MREIRTFVLRLLVDSAEPYTLRGALRPVTDDGEQSFTGDEALLTLLHGYAGSSAPAKAHEGKGQTPKGTDPLQSIAQERKS